MALGSLSRSHAGPLLCGGEMSFFNLSFRFIDINRPDAKSSNASGP